MVKVSIGLKQMKTSALRRCCSGFRPVNSRSLKAGGPNQAFKLTRLSVCQLGGPGFVENTAVHWPCTQSAVQLGAGARRLEAPVDVPAVAHLHDDDDQLVVSNLVNDPPDPLAHSILISSSSEPLAARRSRVACERQNPIHHGAPDLPGFDPLDFLGGRRLDAEAIVSHAASGTSRSPRNATPVQQHAPRTPQGLQRPQQVPSALHHSPSPRPYGHSLLTSASALGERPARSTRLRGGHRSWNQYGVTTP